MKVGELVRCKANGVWASGGETAIIMSNPRLGKYGSSFVDILIKGKRIQADVQNLEPIDAT